MKNFSKDIGVIHFIGIGGIGMSGIAEILFNLGYKVSGSDITKSSNVDRLKKMGIKIFIGQKSKNIDNVSIIVISSAIKEDNVELVAGALNKIPIVRRADMLAELMRFKKSISIGGSHGKTTTTSFISSLLEGAKLDPTVVNGGIIEAYGTNARLGKSDWMVVEADESDGTFIKLPSTYVVITNIDREHIDFYKTFDNLNRAFRNFVENIPFYGIAFICIDSPDAENLCKDIKYRKLITYGFNKKSDLLVSNVKVLNYLTYFDITIKKGNLSKNKLIKNLAIPIPGEHNIRNALAAVAVALELGITEKVIKDSLLNFKGVERRFSFVGSLKNIKIIDDYAHHPTEIKNTLKAAKLLCKGKLIVVFEPHRYTRLIDLYDEFINSFSDADYLYVTKIYSAGEKKIKDINEKIIVNSIKKNGHKNVYCFKDENYMEVELSKIATSKDFIIFLGAGSISKKARSMQKSMLKIINNKL
ncbi:MAG: UDP-N-acetylmuramate--L-alanine ligase [Alphaproteobacteria bacterium MarineAlpha9_Bin3]|nr:MAG: UDP-N-acetylmuramate--L-alanine ligase [Alphaproteobacteria bacterium MarineAlpha9_Bin3]